MPKPRRLTDEQEAAALALHREHATISELARAYNLTRQGMSDCLERAKAREKACQVSRGTESVPA